MLFRGILPACLCIMLVVVTAAPRHKGNPYFHTCRYQASDWDHCVKTVAQELRPRLAEGIPELGLAPLDPLHVQMLNFTEVGGKFHFELGMTNITMEGVRNYVVTGVRSNLHELSLELRLRMPWLRFRSLYRTYGRFLFLSLSGGGVCEYNFTDVDNKIVVKGHMVRHLSDDALYFRAAALRWTMLPSGGSSHFSNLFSGNPLYSQETNRILNDHWEDVWSSFKDSAEIAASEVFREHLNRLLSKVPYRELFPPGILPLHLLDDPVDDVYVHLPMVTSSPPLTYTATHIISRTPPLEKVTSRRPPPRKEPLQSHDSHNVTTHNHAPSASIGEENKTPQSEFSVSEIRPAFEPREQPHLSKLANPQRETKLGPDESEVEPQENSSVANVGVMCSDCNRTTEDPVVVQAPTFPAKLKPAPPIPGLETIERSENLDGSDSLPDGILIAKAEIASADTENEGNTSEEESGGCEFDCTEVLPCNGCKVEEYTDTKDVSTTATTEGFSMTILDHYEPQQLGEDDAGFSHERHEDPRDTTTFITTGVNQAPLAENADSVESSDSRRDNLQSNTTVQEGNNSTLADAVYTYPGNDDGETSTEENGDDLLLSLEHIINDLPGAIVDVLTQFTGSEEGSAATQIHPLHATEEEMNTTEPTKNWDTYFKEYNHTVAVT